MDETPREPLLLRLRVPPRLRATFDVVLALAVTGISTGGLAGWHHGTANADVPLGAFVVVAAGGLSLAFRRRYPRVVFGFVLAAVFANALVKDSPRVTTIALFIAIAALAGRRPIAETLIGAGAAFVALVVGGAIGGRATTWGTVTSTFVTVAAITAFALYVGTRRAYLEQLRARARDLGRERNLLAERAVAEERVRIARELHDAVAHHVSLLVVQAGAIRESLPAGAPEREVADSMAATGRQALSEMRNMLGLLRTDDGRAAEREPQPGVADIRALVDQARAAGVDAELAVEGAERSLPVGVDLSAYRIVQESLTNVVKHAGPANARVLLRYLPDALELRVTDDGKGRAEANGSADGDGHGIVGMRERVALFGGELFAGPVPGGGWAVRALLPVEARS